MRGNYLTIEITPEIEAKFWGLVAKSEGCWKWLGGHTGSGYGRLSIRRGLQIPAHRFSYELLVGPIPQHFQIDHLCRNPGCINPAHLEPVTARENLARGETFNAKNLAKTHCPKGHEYTPDNTKIDIRGNVRMRNCRQCRRDREKLRDRKARWQREKARRTARCD